MCKGFRPTRSQATTEPRYQETYQTNMEQRHRQVNQTKVTNENGNPRLFINNKWRNQFAATQTTHTHTHTHTHTDKHNALTPRKHELKKQIRRREQEHMNPRTNNATQSLTNHLVNQQQHTHRKQWPTTSAARVQCTRTTHSARKRRACSTQPARTRRAHSEDASCAQHARSMHAARTQHARSTHAACAWLAHSKDAARTQHSRGTHAACTRLCHFPPGRAKASPSTFCHMFLSMLLHFPRHADTWSSACCKISPPV